MADSMPVVVDIVLVDTLEVVVEVDLMMVTIEQVIITPTPALLLTDCINDIIDYIFIFI